MTPAFTPDIAGWGRVTLAELNARAPLLDRLENKYVVSAAAFAEAMGAMRDHFDVLAIGGETTFTYETIYYDTDNLLAYRQHAQGKRRRFKIRCRRYVDSDLYFFEVKLKGSRGRTVKHRMLYDDSRHGQDTLDEAATAFVRRCVEDTYGEEFAEHLRAQLRMRYRRLTLVGKGCPERLTVDFDLEFVGPDGARAFAPAETLVVEVKSQNGRGIGDAVLRAAGARGGTCSKYCVGLNLVRPGMRYNVFKQLLRTHFGWKPQAEGMVAAGGNGGFLTVASCSSPLAPSGSQP
ncbi:MAG: polyphosphate polymerase domain-containing protein [Actinomycetota bacterium]|nr:polyphosphate polymerase domain-containing protein [Actinomycetota bacterium]